MLIIPRDTAAALGSTAVEAADRGYYLDAVGNRVDWADLVEHAVSAKISSAPNDPLEGSLLPLPASVTRLAPGADEELHHFSECKRARNTSGFLAVDSGLDLLRKLTCALSGFRGIHGGPPAELHPHLSSSSNSIQEANF